MNTASGPCSPPNENRVAACPECSRRVGPLLWRLMRKVGQPAITAQLVCVGVPQTQHLNPVSEAWVTSDSVKLWTHRKVRNRTGVFLVSFLNPLHSLVDISQHGVIAGNCKC